MDKILEVIKKITINANLISQVKRSGEELYFVYNGAYNFSIMKRNESYPYYFHLYPNRDMSIEDVMNIDWSDFKEFLTYNSNETGGEELYEILYETLMSKLYNADTILNEILGL